MVTRKIQTLAMELVKLNSDDIINCDENFLTELTNETTLMVKHQKPIQENDFFTMLNVRETSIKNKKNKKRHKTKDLMDVINTEMALMGNPIIKNVINVADYTKDELHKLVKSSLFYQTKRHVVNDVEYGYHADKKVNNLSPVFPRVSQNVKIVDPIITHYVQPMNATDLFLSHEQTSTQNVKFLNLELCNLKLKHHHKFSLEKLLVAKLLEIYDEYKSILDNLHTCNKNIKIYRETKNNMTEQLMKISFKKEDVLFDPTLRKYIKQLMDSKDEFMNYKKKYKETVNKIICLWSDIKMVREKMDINTNYQIELIKTTTDEDTYEQKWTELYNQELSDMIDRLEYDYVSKYMEYKQYKYNEKHTNALRNKIHKPKLIIDEELIKENVQSIIEKIVTKEEVTVLIKNNNNDAVNLKLLHKEKESYCFKIYIDNNFVCESGHYNNNGNVDIHFTESFSIQILPYNNTLLIELYENNEKLSNYTLPLGGIKTNAQSVETRLINFIYDLKIAPKVPEVGSGYSIKEIAAALEVRLKSSNIFKDQLCTEFEANIKVGWNTEGRDNSKIKQYMEVLGELKNLHTQKPLVGKLKDVIEHCYEKDVSDDVTVMETIKYLCSIEGSSSAEEFLLTDSNAELTRFKLLHLRNSGKYSDLNNEILPLYSSQLSTEQLNFLQKTNENGCEIKYSDTDKQSHLDPIEMQRYAGYKYILTLNRNILKNLNENLLKKTYQDVVCEFKDFNPRYIFNKEANLTPLNYVNGSMQLEQKQIKGQELLVTIYRGFNLPDRTKPILSEESADEEDDEHVAGFKMKYLRPFVRVSYKQHSAQTATAFGCYPAWNQTLTINIGKGPSSVVRINLYDKVKENVSKAYTEENTSLESRTVHYRYCNRWLGALDVPLTTILSMGKIQGSFKLHTPSTILGYENRSEINNASQALMPEVIQLMKKDNIFISLQICTKTVNSSMNRFNQPSSTYEDDYVIKHLNDFINDYVKDFPNRSISLTFIDSCGQHKCVTQFLQPLTHPDFETFPKNARAESAMSKRSFSKSSTSSQAKSSESKEKKRDVDVESAESATPRSDVWTAGKSDTSLEQMLNCIARYVSLIPTYDAQCYSVTLLGTELLKVLHGSPLDHTLILASYFIYLGVRCWVVVGMSLTRGLTSYVLVKYDKANRIMLEKDHNRETSKGLLSGKKDANSYVIFDATNAEKYEIRDVGCPLKMVFYVFDNVNIWVNVQATVACESVAFDFSKSSEWRPVFDKSMFVSSPANVSDASLYAPAADTEALRATLEAKIKAKMQKWRSRTKTIWNRYCSTVLRELLPQWECWAVNSNETKPQYSHRLKQLLATYKMFGFPLNMPYMNNKSVLSAIKCTAVHLNDDPSVEFALAVNMFSYPNNVISVWVFVASITRI